MNTINLNTVGEAPVKKVAGGVPIVNSVDELNPNSPLGSLACVVEQGSTPETSFRNLYQPDFSMIDQTSGTFTQPELLSSVSSINFLTPTDYSGVEILIVFAPRTFSITNPRMMQLAMSFSNGVLDAIGVMYVGQGGVVPTEYIIGQVVDGVYTINEDVVTVINDILASDDWCYLGYEVLDGVSITEEQFATLDKFAMAVASVPSIANMYIKGDTWTQLYKNDLEKLIRSIDTVSKKVDTKVDSTIVQPLPYNKRLNPNTYYTETNSSTGNLTYVLIAPTDTTKYSEYIIELKCNSTPNKVSFTNESGTTLPIQWANGTPPTFEKGSTYLISIANNFGVFSQYINS